MTQPKKRRRTPLVLEPIQGRARLTAAQCAVVAGVAESTIRRTYPHWVRPTSRRIWAYEDEFMEWIRRDQR